MSLAAQLQMCYLVEWYRPGLDEDHLNDIAAQVDRSSVSVGVEGSPVRRVLTLAVPTDEVVFGVFAAESADAVALVCRRAGMQGLAAHRRRPQPRPASIGKTLIR